MAAGAGGGENSMSKVPHRKIDYDGYTFDSTVEFEHYCELVLLQHAGEITDLVVHPSFVLQAGFIYQDKKIQPIKFTADFEYIENGRRVIEDVKSNWTRTFTDYSIRRRMFIFQHQDVNYREVVR
jgi:hypothetical protein